MFHTILKFIQKHLVLIVTLSIFLLILAFFHEILQPFIIAIIVVYLIDPLVKRMNRVKIRNHNIPRGVAVIVTYLLFLLVATGIGFAFIPSLTDEVSQASEELPRFLTKVKEEDIPRWNDALDNLMYNLSLKNRDSIKEDINTASDNVNDAFSIASEELSELTLPNVDTSGSQPLLINGNRPEKVQSASHANTVQSQPTETSQVLFRFKQTDKNTYEILPGDTGVIFKPLPDGSYTIQAQEDTVDQTSSSFNLEQEFDRVITNLVESSTQYAGSALSLIQYAIEILIDAFVQFILVFMLAAFISIDSPKLMKGIRALFENSKGEANIYDEYTGRLHKGLSGVVQGQLIICCINGTLTGIGLFVLGVDFSLLLGIIAGFLSIVPIFGTIISTIPAVLLGLVQGPITAVLVLGWILFVHFCDTNFFTPKIVGSSSNLHPVIIIFALLAGQYCAGILGLILAVPVTSIIATTLKFILQHANKAEKDAEAEEENLKASQIVPAVLIQRNKDSSYPEYQTENDSFNKKCFDSDNHIDYTDCATLSSEALPSLLLTDIIKNTPSDETQDDQDSPSDETQDDQDFPSDETQDNQDTPSDETQPQDTQNSPSDETQPTINQANPSDEENNTSEDK